MEPNDTPIEWYKKHRPTMVKELAGQPEAVSILKGMLRKGIPQSILLTGPSGTGKTTTARILVKKLGCNPDTDIEEINAADFKGIDKIRDIRKKYTKYAFGKARAYIIDEAHGLTSEAQNAALKMLEDTPPRVYFILGTTDPEKLLQTIRTRCTHIPFKPLPIGDLKAIVRDVAKKESVKLSENVLDQLIEVSNGSARQILVDLQKIAPIEGDEGRLNALVPEQVRATAMTIVNTLIPFKGKPNWRDAAEAIKSCTEDIEKVRQVVLSCAANQIMNQGPMAHRAYLVILAFGDPFFHSRKAGMLAAAWQVFNSK